MNSGSNHPSGNGGRGRKRRRGRRGGQGAGAHSGASSQDASVPPNEGSSQPSQGKTARAHSGAKRQLKSKAAHKRFSGGEGNGNSNGGSNKRGFRGVVNHKIPDAGVYSAPMDHSYRNLQQEGNGGGAEYEAMSVDEHASSRPMVAFIDDLFFMAKIQETSRKLNVKMKFVKSEKEVVEMAAENGENPSLIIFDLNHHTVRPLTVIPKLKAKFKKETNIIGFLSHLQGELKVKAQEAGCDMVLPRSAFSQNLPQLLRRHAASEAELQEY